MHLAIVNIIFPEGESVQETIEELAAFTTECKVIHTQQDGHFSI